VVVEQPTPLGRLAVKTLATTKFTLRLHLGELLAEGLRHPCIASVLAVFFDGAALTVIMDHGGDQTLVESSDSLTGSALLHAVADTTFGVLFLHSRGLVHQDLKPDNVLWCSENLRARVADFGCMRLQGTWSECGGAFEWQAPEVRRRRARPHRVTFNLDAWSLGLLFEGLVRAVRLPPWSPLPRILRGASSPLLVRNPALRGCIADCTRQVCQRSKEFRNGEPCRETPSRAAALGADFKAAPSRRLPFAVTEL